MPLHSDNPSAPASAFAPPLDSPPAPAVLPPAPALLPPPPSGALSHMHALAPAGLGLVATSVPEHPGSIAVHTNALAANAENNCLVRFFTICLALLKPPRRLLLECVKQ